MTQPSTIVHQQSDTTLHCPFSMVRQILAVWLNVFFIPQLLCYDLFPRHNYCIISCILVDAEF